MTSSFCASFRVMLLGFHEKGLNAASGAAFSPGTDAVRDYPGKKP